MYHSIATVNQSLEFCSYTIYLTYVCLLCFNEAVHKPCVISAHSINNLTNCYEPNNQPMDIVTLALSMGPRLSYVLCNLNECVHLCEKSAFEDCVGCAQETATY